MIDNDTYPFNAGKPVSRQTKAILAMIEDKNRLWRENAELRKWARLSPAGQCAKFHVQACHVCENMDCGDNISPGKKRIDELEHENAELKKRVAELEMQLTQWKNRKAKGLGQ